MQQIILAIAGKPGLYKLVSRGNNNLIVEALDGTHKRMPAFATERITSLNDIAMFTETDDVPLMDVLENLTLTAWVWATCTCSSCTTWLMTRFTLAPLARTP